MISSRKAIPMTTAMKRQAAEARLASESRQGTAAARDRAAAQRDQLAVARDLAATERDRVSAMRDHQSRTAALEAARLVADLDREDGGRDRRDAGRDRRDASRDRRDADRDRRDADRDRDQAAEELEALTFDELTKTRRRGPGLRDLEQAINRASLTRQQLAVAYVDVDGLKALNDSEGHAAGDELLKNVTDVVRSDLRRYDSIVRLGGDEFLCVLPGAGICGASSALGHARESIARAVRHGSISVGVAELEPQDTWETLVARADQDLIAKRGLEASRVIAAQDNWSQKRATRS